MKQSNLKEDINVGLKKISNNDLSLNENYMAQIKLTVPNFSNPAEMNYIDVVIDYKEPFNMFSLLTPVGKIGFVENPRLLYDLLHRHFYPNQTEGLTFAINEEGDELLLSYTWVLPSITSDQFEALFTHFSVAVTGQIEELRSLLN
jgi:hypothetical protein